MFSCSLSNSNRNCCIGELCHKSKLWVNQWPLIFFTVLLQVEDFHERYNDTRSLVSDVLEQLSEQDVKLSDLQEALDQAVDYVIQTDDINKENTASLQRREVLCSAFIITLVWNTPSLLVFKIVAYKQFRFRNHHTKKEFFGLLSGMNLTLQFYKTSCGGTRSYYLFVTWK